MSLTINPNLPVFQPADSSQGQQGAENPLPPLAVLQSRLVRREAISQPNVRPREDGRINTVHVVESELQVLEQRLNEHVFDLSHSEQPLSPQREREINHDRIRSLVLLTRINRESFIEQRPGFNEALSVLFNPRSLIGRAVIQNN